MAIKTVLIDNEYLFGLAISSILERDKRFDPPIVLKSAVDFLEDCHTLAFDVVLLDISMPDMDGMEAMGKLLAAQPEARVILITSLQREELVLNAFYLGAWGYLLKDDPPEAIIEAVELVFDHNEKFFSPSLAPEIVSKAKQGLVSGQWDLSPSLTATERKVLVLLANGASNKQVAADLSISMRTVENHRRHIMEKLQVQNVTAMIAKAAGLGLIHLQ